MLSYYPSREMSKSELYSLAFEDPLTKTYNRNMLNEVREYFDVQAFTVTMVDIDNLKHLNDNFGHDAGDKRIRHVADQLKEVAEDVFRLGGDEFLLFSKHSIRPYLSKIAGISYGERVKSGSESLADAMKIADAKMYENKNKRNIKRILNEIYGEGTGTNNVWPNYNRYLKGEEDGGRSIGNPDKPPV